ncbi:uncharacterized protein LOC103092535 isoform X4 [Monodelphis domestica]|uniref:uncharacterized protein LOC103092535 isoform X4 n=1 Tax=Monodelphis domestica TaxID=13616 RepID=UPI0024E1E1FD|nr:uncharacterized protein LOC103092535 isoform X4 [Monodelphis domestica]
MPLKSCPALLLHPEAFWERLAGSLCSWRTHSCASWTCSGHTQRKSPLLRAATPRKDPRVAPAENLQPEEWPPGPRGPPPRSFRVSTDYIK